MKGEVLQTLFFLEATESRESEQEREREQANLCVCACSCWRTKCGFCVELTFWVGLVYFILGLAG